MMALEAIYGQDFVRDADGHGASRAGLCPPCSARQATRDHTQA